MPPQLCVVYDACVLYPNALRDFLIRVAQEGMVSAHWTERILDEVFRNLSKNRPELADRLPRLRKLMCDAVLDWEITDYESLLESLALPDPNDRHVLAAAIQRSAQVIVTFNLSDFPEEALRPHHITALHPDAFALELLAQAPGEVQEVLRLQAAPTKNPALTVNQVLGSLERCGLKRFASTARERWGLSETVS